jgi:recombination protein RecR
MAMFDEVPSLVQLIKSLQQVPCLASKNVYRVASHFLHMDRERLELFCAILLNAKERIRHCPVCFSWQEIEYGCPFCSSKKRDQAIVCVVESWHELLSIEKTGGYTGVFHVLGGVICPLDGVGPDDLTIEPLIKRIPEKQVKELILAMNQTPEGEATASYIAHKLKGTDIKISCLARGIPVGSSLEYMDRLTLYKALSERRPF